MIFDLLLISIFVLVIAYLISQKRPPNFPSGPFGLPVIGHLVQLGESPYLKFAEWKAKYGPVIGINFGSFRTVAVSDYKLVKKVLLDPAFAGRPNMPMCHARSDDVCARGIVFTEGQENSDQRKFASKYIRDALANKTVLDNIVKAEVIEALDALSKEGEEPVSLRVRFHVYILNILWYIVAGQDCEEDRTELTRIFIESAKISQEANFYSALHMFLPWCAKYFPGISGFNDVNKGLIPLMAFFKKHVTQHKVQEDRQPGAVGDMIGGYINQIKNTTDPTSSFYGDVGERSMYTSLLDFFFAGTETASNTLHWSCLYLATNPQVQEKLFAEIDEVVGSSTLPSLTDEVNIPYAVAVIQETLRMSTITPMAVFHSTIQNAKLEEYTIPKDTMVLVNLHEAHYNKDYWIDPEVFRPERFLSPDGKTLIKHEAFMAFGLGRRTCIGEALGRNELFLFLTSIIQRFEILMDPTNPNPSLEPVVAFVLVPQDHKYIFRKRNRNA